MIKASELRIGNFIYDDEGIISKVVGFKPFEHSVRCDEKEGCDLIIITYAQDGQVRGPYDLDLNLIEPIPLTPDWMAKWGFDWHPEEQVYCIQVGNTVYLEYDVDFNCAIVPETWRGSSLHVWGDNKHLHKLQNIYFDHTGEELKIKQVI